jgi:undecaprenyl diphosphate synthase
MDGNGRWAKQRGLARVRGHERGAKAVRAITEACARRGIEWLTLYAFSSENWRRPQKEIDHLMRLLRKFLIAERRSLMKNNLRLTAIGQLDRLPAPAHEALQQTIKMTSSNTRMVLCLALSYGGRQEIADAVRKFSDEVARGIAAPGQINEELFRNYLYDPSMPELDLLIRTAGELRLSNFLLWQCAYAEIYVTSALWPDFDDQELEKALTEFSKRERKFGGTV